MAEIKIANTQEFRNKALSGGGEAVEAFCMAWPLAREVLVSLQSIAPHLPNLGIGFMASMAINIVLAAGDAAKGALCPQEGADAGATKAVG